MNALLCHPRHLVLTQPVAHHVNRCYLLHRQYNLARRPVQGALQRRIEVLELMVRRPVSVTVSSKSSKRRNSSNSSIRSSSICKTQRQQQSQYRESAMPLCGAVGGNNERVSSLVRLYVLRDCGFRRQEPPLLLCFE